VGAKVKLGGARVKKKQEGKKNSTGGRFLKKKHPDLKIIEEMGVGEHQGISRGKEICNLLQACCYQSLKGKKDSWRKTIC